MYRLSADNKSTLEMKELRNLLKICFGHELKLKE